MSAMSPRRVVITGMGLVSPLGLSRDALWENLQAGNSGIAPFQSLPADALPVSFGGESREFSGHIDDFGPLDKLKKRSIKKGLKVMCREIEMGVAAAQRALADAGLDDGQQDPERMGVVYGCDYIMTMPQEFTDAVRNCLDSENRFDFSRWADDGLPKVDPLWLLKYLPNMPASHIAIYNDLRGPNNSLTVREASANLALGEAYHAIARGSADIIIAGATGTRVHPLRTVHVMLQEEMAQGDVEPGKSCRPFDLNRLGMVAGEGAGAVVLEDLETAQRRGAAIFGEIVGQASSNVCDRSGVADCAAAMRNALSQTMRSAGASPDEVGHIHAHGLATHKCDAEEARAINEVFAARAAPLPVTAAKSYFGNLGAGGGVVEFIASVLALQHGKLFPVLNYETPDPECELAVVTSHDVNAGDSFINLNVTPQGQASAVMARKLA